MRPYIKKSARVLGKVTLLTALGLNAQLLSENEMRAPISEGDVTSTHIDPPRSSNDDFMFVVIELIGAAGLFMVARGVRQAFRPQAGTHEDQAVFPPHNPS